MGIIPAHCNGRPEMCRVINKKGVKAFLKCSLTVEKTGKSQYENEKPGCKGKGTGKNGFDPDRLTAIFEKYTYTYG